MVEEYGSVDEMDVFITVEATGQVLFAASFDGGDFSDDHGRIEIIVNP